MLVIVMHNNQDYLDHLAQLAKEEMIRDITIIKRKNIGTRLIGGDATFTFSRGKVIDAYDKAFIAVVKGEDMTKKFLYTINHDNYLDIINIQDKGFVCAVPFHYIKDFKLDISCSRNEGGTGMKIGEFLREDRILLDLNASDKEAVIKELAEVLRDSKEISDFDLFLKDIFARESLSTTGIGNYIAIPHARTDAVKEFVVVFGRSRRGVDFNSLDNKAARFIFLMGTPKNKGLNLYLKLLAHLTRLLSKEDFRNDLFEASSAKEVIDIFGRFEH